MNHPTPNSEVLKLAPLRLLVRHTYAFSGPNPRNSRQIDMGLSPGISLQMILMQTVLRIHFEKHHPQFSIPKFNDFPPSPATKYDSHFWTRCHLKLVPLEKLNSLSGHKFWSFQLIYSLIPIPALILWGPRESWPPLFLYPVPNLISFPSQSGANHFNFFNRILGSLLCLSSTHTPQTPLLCILQ